MQIFQVNRRALIAAVATIATGFSAAPVVAQSTLDKIKEDGIIRVGFANEAPFGYATPEGELTGEAPEIARVVLGEMGVAEIEAVLVPFRSLLPGLQANRFDMIAAGMFVTPKRCEQVLFSEPTYSIGQAMIVAAGNPEDIHGYQDFTENEDLALGVVGGGQAHKYAQAVDIGDGQISVYPDGPSGFAAVEAGRIDAWAMTSLAVQRLLDSKPDAKVERAEPFEELEIDGQQARGHGAFAFRKDDTALQEEFNTYLFEFLGTDAHKELVRPFGFTETEAPLKTTEELCSGS